MDSIPGYDNWLTREPEQYGPRPANASTRISLARYNEETDRTVEMWVEVSGFIDDGNVDGLRILQPIGPQFEVTPEEEEEACIALVASWCSDADDYDGPDRREDY